MGIESLIWISYLIKRNLIFYNIFWEPSVFSGQKENIVEVIGGVKLFNAILANTQKYH